MILEITEAQYDLLFDQLTSGQHTRTVYDTTPDSSLLAIHRGNSVTIAKHLVTESATHWLLDSDEDHHFKTPADIKDQIEFLIATRDLIGSRRNT